MSPFDTWIGPRCPLRDTLPSLEGHARRVLDPLISRVGDLGLAPHQVKALATAACVLAGLVLSLDLTARAWWIWPAVVVIRVGADLLEPTLKRRPASPAGTWVSVLAEPVADAALFLPLLLVPGVPALGVGAFVALSAVVEHAASLTGRVDGPLARSERLVYLLPLVVGAARGGVPALFGAVWLGIGVLGLAWTLVRRIRAGLEDVA